MRCYPRMLSYAAVTARLNKFPASKFPSLETINNYWTRLSKITDLRDTDKSRFIAITEVNNYFIIP